jgi:hypothetical protein
MSKRHICGYALQSLLFLSAVAGNLLLSSSLHAADPVVKKLASGLGSRLSIAVRPDAGSHGEVFIGDGEGGKILRVAIDRSGAAEDVVTGFPRTTDSKDKPAQSGLSSLYFLDHTRLIAAGSDGEQPFVRVYEVPESSSAIRFDDEKQSAEVAAESRHDLEKSGFTGFRSIARPRANDHVGDMLLLAAACGKPVMGLWKIPLRANTLEDAVPFHSATSNEQIRSVDAIAVASSGYVAVALSSEEQKDGNRTLLRFIDPADGRSRLDVSTDLEAILDLAYNPVTADLFAVGLDGQQPQEPNLYRLDDAGTAGKPRCRAKKISALGNATALAFSSEGTLFVACEEKDADGKFDGSLYKLTDF